MVNDVEKKLIARCPFCNADLVICRLRCNHCDTQIDSPVAIPAFFRLSGDLQEFVLAFLRCRGNIREVEKVFGISYPTVCKRLDLVNELLGNGESPIATKTIIEQLECGDITAKQAAQLLKEKGRSS